MKTVTREVVADLWPLYLSGDASPETRLLVEEFLEADPEFARSLGTGVDPLEHLRSPELPPEHEMKTLERVKRRLWGYPLLLQLAIFSSCVALGRLVSDTSWDVSPRNFIVAAVIAEVFWAAFLVTLFRGRRAFLGRRRK